MTQVTDAMHRATRWLADRTHEGILDRYGRMVSAGEVASHIAPQTWLRVIGAGLVEPIEGRFYLTSDGQEEAYSDDPTPVHRGVR